MRLIAFFTVKKFPVIGKIIFVFVITSCAVGFYLGGKAAAESSEDVHRQLEKLTQKASLDSSEETGTIVESQNSEWETYREKKFGYEVKYPEDWEFIEARPRVGKKAQWEGNILLEEELQKVTFLEKEYKLWQGQFRIRVLSNLDNLSLEQWIEKHEPQDVTGGSLIQDISDISLCGEPAKRLSIFGFDHEEIEIVILYKGKVYSIIFAATNPNDPKVKQHQELYGQMLSFFYLY